MGAICLEGESQSAPIGTPPQRQICETAQYLAAVYGWGPTSVLKDRKTISTIPKRRDRQSIPKAGFTPAIWGASTSTDIAAFEARRKDMIIRGGENIYPREIEDVLYTHPAVMGAAPSTYSASRDKATWRRKLRFRS